MKRQGEREEIETWMTNNNVKIAGIQETHIDPNPRESRKEYTWYFSGESGFTEYTQGVAIVIHSSLAQYILDILVEPVTDRLITITLNSQLPMGDPPLGSKVCYCNA